MIGGNPMREVFSRGFGQAGPLLKNDFRNVRQLREEIGRNDQVRIGHQAWRCHKQRRCYGVSRQRGKRSGGARDIACLQFDIRETCGDLARPLRMYDIDEFHNVERIREDFDRNIKEGPGAEHDRAAAAR